MPPTQVAPQDAVPPMWRSSRPRALENRGHGEMTAGNAVLAHYHRGAAPAPEELREHIAQGSRRCNRWSIAHTGQRSLTRSHQRQQLHRPIGRPRHACDKVVRRMAQQRCRAVKLQELSYTHHRHVAAEPKRLVHVVRHEHDCRAEAALNIEQILLRLGADDRIERPERLVHQQHGRLCGERARDADALLLPARELVRKGVRVLGGIELKHLQQLLDPCANPRVLPAEKTWNGGDVLRDGAMWEETVTLDYVADPTPQQVRGLRARISAVDEHAAARGLDEPVDHAQQRRFTGAGRADDHADGIARDRHRDGIDDGRGAVTVGEILDGDHAFVLSRVSTSASSSNAAENAMTTIGIAPRSTRSIAVWPMPWNTNVPSPPPPMSAATVTMPMFCTSTTRMPVRITGKASGSSTCIRTCHSVIPIPCAASTALRETRLSPATVLATIGSRE